MFGWLNAYHHAARRRELHPFAGKAMDSPNTVLRRVLAPPGRLAIHLTDARPGGPIVSLLEDNSPLFDSVAVGWRLDSVDGQTCQQNDHNHAVRLLLDGADRDRVLMFRLPRSPPVSLRFLVVIIANAGFLAVAASWLFVLLPRHLLPLGGPIVANTLTAIGLVSLFNILYQYWRCILVGPGYVASANVGEAATGMRCCATCRTFKPRRSHHCSRCGRCVLRMDHHCTWLDTCVGAYNYASFLLLLLHLTLGATYAVIVNLSVVLLRRGTVIWPGLLALFLLVVIVLASRCIALHVKLIAIGQSTIDHLKDEGGEPAEHDPDGGKRSGGGGGGGEARQAHARWEELFGKEARTSPSGDPGRWTFGSSVWMLMLIAYARSEAVRRLLVKMAIY